MLLLLKWGIIGFLSNLIGMLLMPVLMYGFSILPIVLFRPMSTVVRRGSVVAVCLIIAGLDIFSSGLIPNVDFNPRPEPTAILSASMLTLSCVVMVSWFYFIEENQYLTEVKITEERNRRIQNEKKVTETHLKILQAQIEPHFLFNTLTSILSLSNTDLQKAKIMQNNFIQYLKTTLAKTRSSVTTIGLEIALIKSYLDIFKVRMGNRLQYSIDADKDLLNYPFPSMLIQPIVENSIKHGLEPKIEGGEIRIRIIKIAADRVVWEIADTGLGMSDSANVGTGLRNIMERIESLYGNDASFTMKENSPAGVCVSLEVPTV